MRGVRVPPKLDTESITAPFTGSIGGWSGYVSGFWSDLRSRTQKVDAQVKWQKFHLTNKRGPGGGPAILGWFRDLLSLPESLVGALQELGGPSFSEGLQYLLANRKALIELFGDPGTGLIRKVVAIQDAEGKSRVIAMVDYFSQTVLKPLHLYLFRLLAAISQDVTFDQGSFKEKVSGWPVGVWYSVDLSKATDRFPIDLIALLLGGRFSEPYVRAWREVMVGYPFSSDTGEVSYSVGNPMGAYSSWSSFALCHHFVMYRVSRELGIPWADLQYVILGDDILIGNARAGERYIRLIRELGVEVSPTKTFVSSEMCEFAKRYLFRGTEVSPFPVSSISETREVSLLVGSLLGARMKGLIPVGGIPGAVRGLLRETGSTLTESRLGESLAFSCEKATAFLRGEITASDFVTVICSHPGTRLLPEVGSVSQDSFAAWGQSVLRAAMVDLLLESLVTGDPSFARFYDQMSDRVLYNPARTLWWAELERWVPILAIACQVDEVTLGFSSALGTLRWSREDWKDAIRVMYNPLARDPFGTSPAHRRGRVGQRLGVLVETYLENPSRLAAVNSGAGDDMAFIRAGLLLRDDSMPIPARKAGLYSGATVRRLKDSPFTYLPGPWPLPPLGSVPPSVYRLKGGLIRSTALNSGVSPVVACQLPLRWVTSGSLRPWAPPFGPSPTCRGWDRLCLPGLPGWHNGGVCG